MGKSFYIYRNHIPINSIASGVGCVESDTDLLIKNTFLVEVIRVMTFGGQLHREFFIPEVFRVHSVLFVLVIVSLETGFHTVVGKLFVLWVLLLHGSLIIIINYL
jgi:hypothetical protein